MQSSRHIAVAVLTTVIFTVGTAGYMIIEGWSLFDSLYMTLITVATVGFQEVQQLSLPGRVFTMVLIVAGVGTFLVAAGSVIDAMVEGRLRQVLGRRKLEGKIKKLVGHHVVCGYGRIGRSLCRQLSVHGEQVVVIEQSPERVATMLQDNVLHLVGCATDESLLERAGVQRAKALVSVVGADADNVFLVLTAKQLNPNLTVVSRANRRETIKTLRAAGADRVVSPFEMGGLRIAQALLQPTVTSYLDHTLTDPYQDIHIEEIAVRERSELVGLTLAESGIRSQHDLLVIATKRRSGAMEFNPKADSRIERGDTIIAVGKGGDLAELSRRLCA